MIHSKNQIKQILAKTASQMHIAPAIDGTVGGYKFLNIGFFKMQPKIVVLVVLRTIEHLENSLILQK